VRVNVSTHQGERPRAAVWATRRAAKRAAAAVRAGRLSADGAFDRFLPIELRDVSALYWTPLPVVRRVVAWLRDARVRTVVDVGSGAGKFCVAGALLSRCRFVGLEQRASLVAVARELADTFDVTDRVTFHHGQVGAAPMPSGDAYYVFNPFGEYAINAERFAEPDVAFTPEGHSADIASVTSLLSSASAGTLVVTYNGIGGRFPPGYLEVDVVRGLPGTLRLWRRVDAAAR